MPKLADQRRIIDVREMVEWNEGHIPSATLVPLADFAATIETVVPDKSTPLVHCAVGARSARLAVPRPDRIHGRPEHPGTAGRVEGARRCVGGPCPAPDRCRAGPLLAPSPHPRDRPGRAAQAARLARAADRGRRPGLAGRAAPPRPVSGSPWTTTSSTSRTFSARCSTPRTDGMPRPRARSSPSRRSTRTSRSPAPSPAGREQRGRAGWLVRRDRGRDGQLRPATC